MEKKEHKKNVNTKKMKLTNIKSNDVTEKFGIVLICSSTDLKADVFLAG
jgi:hypothetical protein